MELKMKFTATITGNVPEGITAARIAAFIDDAIAAQCHRSREDENDLPGIIGNAVVTTN
jgi:hypothetical protein